MVRGKWFVQGADISAPLALREEIFTRGRDALDDMAQQVVVYHNDLPVGIARLWWADGAFQLGDVGVLPGERGKGYGDLLVRLALYKALTHHASRVGLTAPLELAPFFARYGFTPTHDPVGSETHVSMAVRAEDIALGHCAKQRDGAPEGNCTGDCAGCQED